MAKFYRLEYRKRKLERRIRLRHLSLNNVNAGAYLDDLAHRDWLFIDGERYRSPGHYIVGSIRADDEHPLWCHTIHIRHVFGFADTKQFVAWFNNIGRIINIIRYVRIAEYQVPKEHLILDEKQCVADTKYIKFMREIEPQKLLKTAQKRQKS